MSTQTTRHTGEEEARGAVKAREEMKQPQAPEQKMQEGAGQGISHGACDFSSVQVNPDVISHNPREMCSVKYGQHTVTQLGQRLLVKHTQQQPQLNWSNVEGKLYTVLMLDPDAPSRSDPRFRNYLHWCLVNVPNPRQLDKGFTACEYMGPAPPAGSGPHRYAFLVWQQEGAIERPQQCADRKSFDVRNWLHTHRENIHEGNLVAGNMFLAENEK